MEDNRKIVAVFAKDGMMRVPDHDLPVGVLYSEPNGEYSMELMPSLEYTIEDLQKILDEVSSENE
jgi:hypothetical protein